MKILIADDGSEFGRGAVEYAANIVDHESATEVKIVTVVVPAAAIDVETFIESVHHLTDPGNPLAQQAEHVGGRAVEFLEEKLAGANVQITHEVLGGSAARAIVEKAEEWGADLIIVGSHGHGLWKRTWLGSVSDLIVHHAPCSVLIVRPKRTHTE
jgi:nucleotide-binding universal stress UspA family protein